MHLEFINITPAITILLAILSLIIAFATWLSKTKNDRGIDKAEDARVITKLEFISDDVKDIKADYRSFRTELNEVKTIAVHASERAEAAHNRLDRMDAGIEGSSKHEQ